MDDIRLQYEIEQALYHEAALLDEHRYEDWLAMLTDDIVYWMPIRSTRAPGDEANEFTNIDEASYFNDDRKMLETRIVKLRTGFSWAEDPLSRTRHNVFNVRVLNVFDNDEVQVASNFIVHRDRLNGDTNQWVGRREDRMRRTDRGWRICKRAIYLDHTLLKSKNLSTFL